jgi:hypothetical protein
MLRSTLEQMPALVLFLSKSYLYPGGIRSGDLLIHIYMYESHFKFCQQITVDADSSNRFQGGLRHHRHDQLGVQHAEVVIRGPM